MAVVKKEFDKNSKGSIAYSALCDEFLSQQK